ncbi:MAG: biotin/lipoyl-containing protein, partial [Vicinamibacteria bacterium]
GETCHGLVESEEMAERAAELTREPAPTASADGRLVPRVMPVEVGGRRYEVTVLEPEPPWAELARRRRERASSGRGGAGTDAVVCPMQGTVLKVDVSDGDEVEAGKVICVVEAMKMENELKAARDGVVRDVSVVEGQSVDAGTVLVLVE